MEAEVIQRNGNAEFSQCGVMTTICSMRFHVQQHHCLYYFECKYSNSRWNQFYSHIKKVSKPGITNTPFQNPHSLQGQFLHIYKEVEMEETSPFGICFPKQLLLTKSTSTVQIARRRPAQDITGIRDRLNSQWPLDNYHTPGLQNEVLAHVIPAEAPNHCRYYDRRTSHYVQGTTGLIDCAYTINRTLHRLERVKDRIPNIDSIDIKVSLLKREATEATGSLVWHRYHSVQSQADRGYPSATETK